MRLKDFVKQSGGTIGETLWLPPAAFEVEPDFNPRERTPELEAHIREIANSILADGFDPTQHLVVRYTGERVLVRDGRCRLEAIALANKERPGCVVRVPLDPMPGNSNELDDAYLVLSTQTKKPLTATEYAAQVRRLLRSGQTEAEVAARLGKKIDALRRLMDLAGAPREIRDAVSRNELSQTEAVNLVRREGERAPEVIAKAREHAAARGSKAVRPRDIAAVEKPRTEGVSLCSLAVAVVWAWRRHAGTSHVDQAIAALEQHLGAATLDAAREKLAAREPLAAE